jgi:hypothetical protein
MTSAAVRAAPPTPPSFSAYNIRFLSLSANQKERWEMKLASVQHLVRDNAIVGLLETHATAAQADLFFTRHVGGVKSFYDFGIAVLVQDDWFRDNAPIFEVVIAQVMVCLSWKQDGFTHWQCFFRLDAHAESTRCEQLSLANAWAKNRIQRGDWVAFAGDRNFVRDLGECQSSASSQWQPSSRMNAAWADWLRALGHAEEVCQPEFTWNRVARDGESSMWVYEILDVAGTNRITTTDGQAVARRVDSIPYPSVSDHRPVALR